MKPATSPSSVRLSTSRRCDGTIADGCGVEPSTSETSSSVLCRANKDRHKLSLPWEGPYVITEVLRSGTYKLKTINGEVFTNAWNIVQLCRFYP